MPSIFISYRRNDAPGHAGRIYDSLVERFGKDSVFMDRDSTPPGADFAEVIKRTIAGCDALLAVIGRDWLSASRGVRRGRQLDDPQDWVRREIAAALARNIPVVPVLVEGAQVPSEGELPEEIGGLSRRHAIELSETAWVPQLRQLIDALAAASPPAASKREALTSPPEPGHRDARGRRLVTRRVSSPAFVGRRPQLATLVELAEQARSGRPSLCFVEGEAGIGKTRLAREFEERAARMGLLCLWGHCMALAGGEFPFAPLVAVFRQLADGPASSVIADLAGPAHGRLRALLPELDAGGPAGSEATGVDGVLERALIHETLTTVLRRAADHTPTAVLIEDLHWADRSTRDFVSYLARNLDEERLTVVATYRDDELRPDHPLRSLVAELIRCEPVVRIRLQRLSVDETAAQLAAIAGRPLSRGELGQVYDKAEGNPFLAEELWGSQVPGGHDAIPVTLRDAVLARVRALPSETRGLVRLVAAFGRPVGHDELTRASGREAPRVTDALRPAVEEHVLVVWQGGPRLTFRHALVREALEAEQLPGERERLHRTILAALRAAGSEIRPAELAYHYLAAGEQEAGLAASIEAGLESARRFAYPEALDHLERALSLCGSGVALPEHSECDRVDLHAEAAEAARVSGEYERAIEHCREALKQLDGREDPVRAAQFLERLSRFQSWDVERSLAGLGQALRLLPDGASAERARLMTSESLELSLQGRWLAACARADEALAVALDAGAEPEACSARIELGLALAFVGEPAVGLRHLQEALGLAERLGATEELARVHLHLAELERLQGRADAAFAALSEGRAAVTRLGAAASWGALMAVVSADDLLQLGRWDELDGLLKETEALHAGRVGAVMWPLVAGQLSLARGHLEPAAALLERSWARALDGVTPELLPHLGAARAELECWRGRPAHAHGAIEDARRLLGSYADPLNTPVLYGASVAVEVSLAAKAAVVGDRDEQRRAQGQATRLIEDLDRLLVATPGLQAPPRSRAQLEQARAELATCRGETMAAARWADVATTWNDLANPLRAAHARLRQADALLAIRSRHRDAAAPLRAAYEAARELGAGLLAREAEALARRARISLEDAAPPAGDGGAPPHALAELGLTHRELEVLTLVADGLTNRQIAERLFITPKTAGLHVSHILAKLNVDTRVKAAAFAHRQQPPDEKSHSDDVYHSGQLNARVDAGKAGRLGR
jgi:DNA-binding CsgD family transcriptional regulator